MNMENNEERPWTPQFFEEEMQSIQPDYDLVFERYANGPATLMGSLLNETREIDNTSESAKSYHDDSADDLNLTDIIREKETLLMMRNLGIESSLGGKLDSKKTLPTHQTKSKTIYEKNLPILLDEEFFQLKPTASTKSKTIYEKNLPSGSTSNSSSVNSSSETNTSSIGEGSISLESTNGVEGEVQSPLDKILGINREPLISSKTLEEKYFEDFPDLKSSESIKTTNRFCVPQKLYNNKKKIFS